MVWRGNFWAYTACYSKEIEISFPSSGDTDYDFTRRLVDTPDVVPHDVALQVLSPCECIPGCLVGRGPTD